MPLQSMEHQNWEGMYPNVFPRKLQTLNFLVRFVIGRPLDNKARTDASFWHAATKGYPSRWLRLPGYARAGVRLSLSYGILLFLVLRVGAYVSGEWVREVLLWHAVALSLLSLAVGIPRLILARGLPLPRPRWEEKEEGGHRLSLSMVRLVEGRARWEREKILPVARVAAPLLQIEHRRLRAHAAREWVTVPRSYLSPTGRPVEIALPHHFSGADEKHNARLVRAVSSALGASDMEPSWQLAGQDRRLLLSAPELPPEKVSYQKILPHLQASEEYRPVLGMVSPAKVLHAEMIADSPHILVSGGPGSGKSSLLKTIIAQAMHWGWGILVLDWKRTKQFEWLHGMRGVRIINSLEGIHDAGVQIGEEVETRMNNGMTGKPRLLVVRDEWNVTAVLLQEYWVRYRALLDPEERKVTPVKSPGLQGFNMLDFAGREYGMHDLLAAQKASNRIFNFNTDMRDCFNIRIIGRYSPETKRMLFGNIKPFPRRSNIPGRWVVGTGDEIAVVQAPWLENEEAREFAMSGKECPTSPFVGGGSPEVVDSGSSPVRAYVPPTQGKQLPDRVTPVDYAIELVDKGVKLSVLADGLDHLGVTKKILQHAAGDPLSGFPVPIGGSQFKGYEYDRAAVKAWALSRLARVNAEKEKGK
jgi:hypothetical protein